MESENYLKISNFLNCIITLLIISELFFFFGTKFCGALHITCVMYTVQSPRSLKYFRKVEVCDL